MTKLLPLLALLLSAPVLADAPATFHLKHDDARVGSLIKRDVAISTGIPLNKRYDELTDEQKGILNDSYEAMAEGDEPPFPKNGLAPVMKAVSVVQRKFLATGTATFLVDVSGQGAAQNVSVLGNPNPQVAKAIATVLMLTPYKPALCKGTPCRMTYPLRLELRTTSN